MPDEKDPWASLADALGAAPNRETPPPPPQHPPQKPRPERPAEGTRAAAARITPGWDDLDASLGLPTGREAARPAEPRPAEKRPVEQRGGESRGTFEQRSAERHDAEERREYGSSERPARADSVERGGDARLEGGQPQGDETHGEDRPRGRRGRRGGRGRGGRGRREDATAPRRDDEPRREADLEAEPIDDLTDERPAAPAEPGDRPLDEEGRPRRRRRRRGRRGGRRGGAAAETTGESAGQRPRTDAPSRDAHDESDDEPLPAGYGRPQATRQPEQPRDSEDRAAGGERRGRRRRRRGRGDDGERRPTNEAGGEPSRRRGRRSRRGADGERTSSTSSLARRSRDDFAPVARGYDEDDEGLEFLGVEEASREQPPRREPRHAEEDEVLVESGLNAVRDVPSWVEAIGIVIAGNLDARSRPRADRGDDDRRRK